MDGRKRHGMRFSMSAEITTYTSDEMMIIASARRFCNGRRCFVGVGLPSVAACVAREKYAPDVTLIYESGAIGAKPTVPPLSIADIELAETASLIVSVPEIFAYWLQAGRIDIGFVGAAQIDRFANINSTVIGDYAAPKIRLPGAGGAPQIAANTREVVVIMRQSTKAFVAYLDFLTTPRCKGPTTVITDLGIMQTNGATGELALTSIHPDVTLEQVREATAWPLEVSSELRETVAPSLEELAVLREVNARAERGLRTATTRPSVSAPESCFHL
jgi:glutaconate CoA-transferase, subunit B